jgi:hypothetical protein
MQESSKDAAAQVSVCNCSACDKSQVFRCVLLLNPAHRFRLFPVCLSGACTGQMTPAYDNTILLHLA